MRECNIAVPSPLLLVCLGVLGLALWGGMGEECADFYWYHLKVCVQSVRAHAVCTSCAGLFCASVQSVFPSPPAAWHVHSIQRGLMACTFLIAALCTVQE